MLDVNWQQSTTPRSGDMEDDHPTYLEPNVHAHLPTSAARFGSALDSASLCLLPIHLQDCRCTHKSLCPRNQVLYRVPQPPLLPHLSNPVSKR